MNIGNGNYYIFLILCSPFIDSFKPFVSTTFLVKPEANGLFGDPCKSINYTEVSLCRSDETPIRMSYILPLIPSSLAL